jgi:ribosomal protein S27AE
MARPVQLLGAHPDGVHRFIFQQCREGLITANHEMLAAEYGIRLFRWEAYVHSLEKEGKLRRSRIGQFDKCPQCGGTLLRRGNHQECGACDWRESRFTTHFVEPPEGFDPEDGSLGQTDAHRLVYNPYIRKPGQSAEEASDLIDAYEALEEECLDLLDEMDLDGEVEEIEEEA